MAKIGHRTLTKSQSNQIKDQVLIELFSIKEVMKKKIERFKTEIERFYWRDESKFSTKDCLTEISSLYNEILIDLKHIMSLEDLEGETDWEEINELIETVMELKSENLYIFKNGQWKMDKSTMDKSTLDTTMRSTLGTMTLGTMRSTMDNHEDRKGTQLGNFNFSDDKEGMISTGNHKPAMKIDPGLDNLTGTNLIVKQQGAKQDEQTSGDNVAFNVLEHGDTALWAI